MARKNLTLEQSVCGARIFLNTFGLILEDKDDIHESSLIKIFDKNNNIIGCLFFDEGKVKITARTNDFSLRSNYEIPSVLSFSNEDDNNIKFGEWDNEIKFDYLDNKATRINGEFLVSATMDTEYGLKCHCHPVFNCSTPNTKKFTLRMVESGMFFGLDIINENYNEKIIISPDNRLMGYLRHRIQYNDSIDNIDYSAGVSIGVGDNLHIFKYIENNEYESDKNEYVKDEKSNIQKGLLMKENDPSMYSRIEELRKLLTIGDLSLLDNLVSICYGPCSEELVDALIGIKKHPMIYQDGSNNLVDSYFGLNGKSLFLPTEQLKKAYTRK